jgi:CRP/FNR family transcriptional regulator, cyclic AMP receptor protein
VFLMLDETGLDIDKTTERREFKTTVEGVAHWAGMSVNEVRDVLGHYVNQRRVEIFPDRIIVKNINDFARYVSSRRKDSRSR